MLDVSLKMVILDLIKILIILGSDIVKKTKIEWTEISWNPITGCSKVSDGCKNCYAERMAKRLKAMNNPRYLNGFSITIHDDLLNEPFKWKKPQLVFVNSMTDLFHEDIELIHIKKVFEVMNKADNHTFQVLTKRANRLKEIAIDLIWSKNIWMGVTVESSKYKNRIDLLREVPAKIRFLSIEPLLDDLGTLDLSNIDWVIVGGESGPKSRPMNEEWVKNIKEQCEKQNVLFYFKQWGGFNKKKTGRLLDGKEWNDMPKF